MNSTHFIAAAAALIVAVAGGALQLDLLARRADERAWSEARARRAAARIVAHTKAAEAARRKGVR